MVDIKYELNTDGCINLLEAFLVQCRRDYLVGVPNSKRNDIQEIETAIIGMFGREKGGTMVLELRRQKKSELNRKIYKLTAAQNKARY